MTQRITPQMQSGAMLSNINADLAALDKTQNELSTGMKILQPSDDPSGIALSLQLGGQVAVMNNYTSNVNDGTAWANTASAALQSIQQITQTVRSLVVEANNGTMSAPDRDTITVELNQLIEQVKDTANTQYNGMYIFSGSQTTTQPYDTSTDAPTNGVFNDTYSGDNGSVNRTIGPGTAVAVNAQLSTQVLGQGQQANGGSGDGLLLNTLETASQDVTSGDSTALGNDLSSLDTNITSLESLQAQVGSTQQQLSMASSRLQSFQTTLQTQLANTEDVDMGQASINFSTEQAAYTAALQSGAQIIQMSLLNFLKS